MDIIFPRGRTDCSYGRGRSSGIHFSMADNILFCGKSRRENPSGGRSRGGEDLRPEIIFRRRGISPPRGRGPRRWVGTAAGAVPCPADLSTGVVPPPPPNNPAASTVAPPICGGGENGPAVRRRLLGRRITAVRHPLSSPVPPPFVG